MLIIVMLYHVHTACCSFRPRRRVTSLVPSLWYPVTVRRGVAPVRLRGLHAR